MLHISKKIKRWAQGLLASVITGAVMLTALISGAGVAAASTAGRQPSRSGSSSVSVTFNRAAKPALHASASPTHKKGRPSKDRLLYDWAKHQLGKVDNPWGPHEGLMFTDDGMQAVGLHPQRMPTAAIAWETYASEGLAEPWSKAAKSLQRGDLVFWGPDAGGLGPDGHAAIYGGDGTVIEDLNGVIRRDPLNYSTPDHTLPTGFVKTTTAKPATGTIHNPPPPPPHKKKTSHKKKTRQHKKTSPPHHKKKAHPKKLTTSKEYLLDQWAQQQVGKVDDPWRAHWCLQFTDDGMQAVGLHPLRKDTASDAWEAYASMGLAEPWSKAVQDLSRGDLVFWGPNSTLAPDGHVAIYDGNGKIIENIGGVIRRDSVYFPAPGNTAPTGFVKT